MTAQPGSCTKRRHLAVLCVFFLTVVFSSQNAFAQLTDALRDVERSIIKIYTTTADPDYFTPWRLMSPGQSSGSGAVIAGERILTNAHVVANASYIQVQKHNDPRRYLAQVEFVSHASDLALLHVEDSSFFNDTPALQIGELPQANTEVFVFGYPVGGRTLSITKGILSRVEHQVYAHAGNYLLAGQIDAAINPGNSGGPVIVDGQIAGVVMQSVASGRTESLGYFVPPDIIEHVLTDAQNGVYDGFPDLGIRTQDLESPSAKTSYGLSDEQSGVLVIKVFEGSSADGVIQENDVILSIEGYDIAGDSSIRISEDLQTDYKHAIDMKQIGEQVEVTFSRMGNVNTVSLKAQRQQESDTLVRPEAFDALPEYYIYGGILFVPLNMNLIKRWGPDWSRTAPVNLLQARSQWSSPERREAVVALQVLPADVNLGYHDVRNWIVESVNGTDIRDFSHFTSLLRYQNDNYSVFRSERGYQIVIDHQQAKASEQAILQQYRIPAPYSEGLFPAGE